MTEPLLIATRESRLALWQAKHVQQLLQQRLGVDTQLLPLSTRGDEILDRSLSKIGGKGLFIKELEMALEAGRAHLAVHSLKDVPMDLPPGFALAAVLQREDPRDAWVSNRFASIDALPSGATVGTSSLRRCVQLQACRPDLAIEPVRGNLDTRLRKLDEGGFDALVLAAAGLNRLGLAARINALFDPADMLPCAGQGALGLEIRADAHGLLAQLAGLSHRPTALAVEAERAVSRTLGGSCSVPLGAYAEFEAVPGGEPVLWLRAVLGAADGEVKTVGHAGQIRPLLHAQARAPAADVPQAIALGERVALQLQQAGAAAYLAGG